MKLLKAAGLGGVAALPLLAGCANTDVFEHHSTEFASSSNARAAFLRTEATHDPTFADTADAEPGATYATITADGGTATFTNDDDGITLSDQKKLARANTPSEVYGDATSYIAVERKHGLNEQDDTFLTFQEHHIPESPTSATEFIRGYAGTRSDASVVAELRGRANHSATYSGTGSAMVAQHVDSSTDTYSYNVDGPMALTAQFTGADAGLAGQIVQTARTDPATNPDGVNQVRFTGKFIDDSPDYRIGDLSLYNAKGKFASLSNGGGVGSFFGAHAQGTMGAFSATNMDAQEKDPNHVPGINLLGSFSGTTSDNNP